MEKNDAQISRAAVVKKPPSPWKKFFQRKVLSPLYVKTRSTNRCVEIFSKKMGRETFKFRWFFSSKKLFFTIKLSIKLDQQKIKKITRNVLETIISQIILVKFYKIGLNPEELELLECALVITFFNKNYYWVFSYLL